MKLEPTLHKAVLAGVGRVPLTADALAPGALQDLLSDASQPASLWHALAATDLWQRAGFAADTFADPVPACAAEAPPTRAAERVLQRILHGDQAELLDSWLAHARAAGTVVPHACLVTLLERAAQSKALRLTLAPVLGQRGRWLVAQHPKWLAAFDVDLAEAEPLQSWELGNPAQRVATLRALRRSDPQAALAMLAADWAQEPADSRIALLPCLEIGLSASDEPFLEQALDDKRKDVRVAAKALLAQLPESQLAERCKTRLLTCFNYDGTLGITLPAELDKAMKRDGIGNQPHYGLGEKAGWLLELMQCVAPTFWSAHWQLAPLDVIKLFAAQEFKAALLTGLAHAAGNALATRASEADLAWFVALIEYESPDAKLDMTELLLPHLPRLPLPEQERIVGRWLARSDRNLQAFSYAIRWADEFVTASTVKLPAHMSAQLLGHIQRHMLAVPQPNYSTSSYLRTLARVLDAGNLDYTTANWPAPEWEHWPLWRPMIDQMMETLTFRHTLQTSFLENTL